MKATKGSKTKIHERLKKTKTSKGKYLFHLALDRHTIKGETLIRMRFETVKLYRMF